MLNKLGNLVKDKKGNDKGNNAERNAEANLFNKVRDASRKGKRVVHRIKMVVNILVTILPKTVVALLAVYVVAVTTVIVASAWNCIDKSKETMVSDAKAAAVTTSSSSTDATVTNSSKIVIAPTTDETGNITGYNINYEQGDFDKKRSTLNAKTADIDFSSDEFTDEEIAVLYAMYENGFNFDGYSEEELHLLPLFIKAEATTQLLDLRKNADKSTPFKLENIQGTGLVPGVIKLKRGNSQDNTDPVDLEYIGQETFDNYITNNNEEALKHFTLDEDGKVWFATKSFTEVSREGEYPVIYKGEREDSSNTYILDKCEFPVKEYVKGYDMPFDLLVQLLVRSTDVEFSKELVNYIFNSEIVLNIQENPKTTQTKTVQTFHCYQHIDKKVDWKLTPDEIASGNGTLIEHASYGDSGEACTSYSEEQGTVTITRTVTSYVYTPQILKVDTWYIYQENKYGDGFEKKEGDINVFKSLDSQTEPDYYKINSPSEPSTSDDDVNNFKTEKINSYCDTANNTVPNVVSVKRTYVKGDQPKTDKYKFELEGANKSDYTPNFKDGEEITGNPPDTVCLTDKANTKYYFSVPNEDNEKTGELQYSISIPEDLACDVTGIAVETWYKCDVIDRKYSEQTTSYSQQSEPTVTGRYYAKNETTGDFEKFCLALSNSKIAQNNLGSAQAALFSDMEQNDKTEPFVSVIKYMMYVFDGENRGVTELESPGVKTFDEFMADSLFGNRGTNGKVKVGDVEVATYTHSCNGKTYIEYKQNEGPWAESNYARG